MSKREAYYVDVICPKCGETRKRYKYDIERRGTALCRKCLNEKRAEECTVTVKCITCGLEKTMKKAQARHWITGECQQCASKRTIKIAKETKLASATGLKESNDGYILIKDVESPLAQANGYVFAHWKVVYDLLGDIASPQKGHQIHHVDGNPKNNEPSNLVVCQDNAYHALLHARAKAFYGCGDVNKRQCYICKEFDEPENMIQRKNGKGSYWHKECERIQRARKKATKLGLANDPTGDGSQDQNSNQNDGQGDKTNG